MVSVPHGGKLQTRIAAPEEREEFLGRRESLRALVLNGRELSDLMMIGIGAYSPLTGFMCRADYERVVGEMRLASGQVWSLPVTLAVSEEEAKGLSQGDLVLLLDDQREPAGVLEVEEVYGYDKVHEARRVYLTEDASHPGVDYLYRNEDRLVGGRTLLLRDYHAGAFPDYRLEPAEVRRLLQERGWSTVVGFKTRNPIHRAHEYLIKCAMEIVDGALINPLVGATKEGDVPAAVRMRCYEALLGRYFPPDRVLLVVLDTAMRYAGPREAIFHALVRKNFGCTHFIVGRDHAGVGNFYGPFDAQRIFLQFKPQELGITPLFFDNAFFCRKCQAMASVRTCPHPPEDHMSLSGTRVREMLAAGEIPPPELTRPEVAEVLLEAYHQGNL